MRELTFDECETISGGGRFGGFFRALKALLLGGAGGYLAEQVDEATDEPPPSSFDPTSEEFVAHGPAWGENELGTFQSGQYWLTADGVTYTDMNRDNVVDGAMYTGEDGTVWQDAGLTGNWTAVSGPN